VDDAALNQASHALHELSEDRDCLALVELVFFQVVAQI